MAKPLRAKRVLTEAAVVAWVFAGGTRAVEIDLADTAHIIFGDVPSPGSDRIPFLNLDLHYADGQRGLVLMEDVWEATVVHTRDVGGARNIIEDTGRGSHQPAPIFLGATTHGFSDGPSSSPVANLSFENWG